MEERNTLELAFHTSVTPKFNDTLVSNLETPVLLVVNMTVEQFTQPLLTPTTDQSLEKQWEILAGTHTEDKNIPPLISHGLSLEDLPLDLEEQTLPSTPTLHHNTTSITNHHNITTSTTNHLNTTITLFTTNLHK